MTEAELSTLNTLMWVSVTVYCCTHILLHWVVEKNWRHCAVVPIGLLCMVSIIATAVLAIVVAAHKPDYKAMVEVMRAQGYTLSLDHVGVEDGD